LLLSMMSTWQNVVWHKTGRSFGSSWYMFTLAINGQGHGERTQSCCSVATLSCITVQYSDFKWKVYGAVTFIQEWLCSHIFKSVFQIYKSSSKRKAHILKNHPGAELPMSNRRKVNHIYFHGKWTCYCSPKCESIIVHVHVIF
jgi:hypothetical protein